MTAKRTAKTQAQRHDRHRDDARNLPALIREEGVEFYAKGPSRGLPKCAHPKRKADCASSLALFATTYQTEMYRLKMSDGQREDLEIMQRVVEDGGRFAFACPRGDGKTTRTETAVLWAMLYGLRNCMVIVGSDLGAALEILESIKLELRTNERLREDFPVPCWAAAIGDDTALRVKALHWNQQDTHMAWSKHRITLPVLTGADGSGCTVMGRGLTGRLRGIRIKVDGEARRPDLFAVDDPQTDESAASPSQCDARERILLGAVLGSGGPGETIACMLPCTVIRHDDLASRMLDHKRHPDWQGRTRGMIGSWPTTQETLWREYIRIRREDSHEAATEYYSDNRERMDKGATVDWPERYIKGMELSALQASENFLCDLGEEVYWAEYQNAPKEKHLSVYDLTPSLIASRVDRTRQNYDVPASARIVTAFTDINNYGLHWACTAFSNDSTGWLVAYGVETAPDGHDIVQRNAPELERKRLLYEALVRNGRTIASLPLSRGGQQAKVGLWVIDGGYLHDVVQRYVQSEGATLGIPVAVSRGYSADRYRPTPRNVIGQPREQCHLTESTLGRFLAFNMHYWCEVAQRAWLGSVGAPGSLSLFNGQDHTVFSEHICRDKLVEKLEGKFGTIWKYHTAPGRHDYGDAVYGCYIAAAWAGIGTSGTAEPRTKPKTYRETRKAKIGA